MIVNVHVKENVFSKCKISALPCNRQNRIRFILHVSAEHQCTLIQKPCRGKRYLLKLGKKKREPGYHEKDIVVKDIVVQGTKTSCRKKKTAG